MAQWPRGLSINPMPPSAAGQGSSTCGCWAAQAVAVWRSRAGCGLWSRGVRGAGWVLLWAGRSVDGRCCGMGSAWDGGTQGRYTSGRGESTTLGCSFG